MDENYVNDITIECFSNKQRQDKLKELQLNKLQHKIEKEDIKFYRKRIMNFTKNILKHNLKRDKNINEYLHTMCYNYIYQLIELFKKEDATEIIQKEYEELEKNNKSDISGISEIPEILDMSYENIIKDEIDIIIDENMNISEANDMIMKKNKFQTNNTLDHFIIKKDIFNNENENENNNDLNSSNSSKFPQIKVIQLKEPELKYKGINREKKKMKKKIKEYDISMSTNVEIH